MSVKNEKRIQLSYFTGKSFCSVPYGQTIGQIKEAVSKDKKIPVNSIWLYSSDKKLLDNNDTTTKDIFVAIFYEGELLTMQNRESDFIYFKPSKFVKEEDNLKSHPIQISTLVHSTHIENYKQIINGVEGKEKNPPGRNILISWWSPKIEQHHVDQIRNTMTTEVTEFLKQYHEGTIPADEKDNFSTTIESYATSPVFSGKSRYGALGMECSISTLLESYIQYCGEEYQCFIFGTQAFAKEHNHVLLIAPKSFEHKYPILSNDNPIVTLNLGCLSWKPTITTQNPKSFRNGGINSHLHYGDTNWQMLSIAFCLTKGPWKVLDHTINITERDSLCVPCLHAKKKCTELEKTQKELEDMFNEVKN